MEIAVPRAAACALFNTMEETNTSIELVMSNSAIRRQRVFGLGRSYSVEKSSWGFAIGSGSLGKIESTFLYGLGSGQRGRHSRSFKMPGNIRNETPMI